MTLSEIKKKKSEYGYSNEQMAKLSGLPLSTVQKVLGGTTKSPRYSTIRALESVFPKDPPFSSDSASVPAYESNYSGFGIIREAPAPYATVQPEFDPADQEYITKKEIESETSEKYPRQGSYTLEDYLALPDDQRVELIDGVFYDMSSPTMPHQLIGGEIFSVIRNFISKKGGNCVPFMAPADVQLDCDNKTIVQPDVMIVCDRSKITRARIVGAPDFIIEVLSPSTKRKDMFLKSGKYIKAGVREYWMIDPKREKIIKQTLLPPDEDYPYGDIDMHIFGFKDKVPISIFHDECVIDFEKITESYSFIKDPV